MQLANAAQGRWHGILSHLGVDPTYLRNRNGPCPGCGGTDRFRWDDKDGRGTFFCNGAGDPVAGDGFGLVKHIHECDFPTAARKVEEALGGKRDEFIPRKSPPKRNTTATAEKIWQSTQPDEFGLSWDAEVAGHPYAQLKGIEHAFGAARATVSGRVIGKDADCLVIPLRRLNRHFAGVEVIGIPVWNEAKKKHITPKQTFGSKGILVLGNTLDKTLDCHLTEGWADACSIWSARGNVLVIAVFGGIDRQLKLAELLDEKEPNRRYIVAEDA
jgi:phage/plasmid primase-like uncharacterized protein